MQAFRFPVQRGNAGADRRRMRPPRSARIATRSACRSRCSNRGDDGFGDRDRRRRASSRVSSFRSMLAPAARLDDYAVGNSIVPQFVIPSKAMMSQDALPLADETASRLTIASALQGRCAFRISSNSISIRRPRRPIQRSCSSGSSAATAALEKPPARARAIRS